MPLPSTLAPPTRRLMREEAYERLRELIATGVLAPNEPLRDQAIARWLGVSRMPVREALARLAGDGLVVIAANRFTRVAALDGAVAAESHRLLGLLEAEIVAQVARATGDPAAHGQLAETFRWALWRGDVEEAISADRAFHRAIRQGSESLAASLADGVEPLARRAQRAAWIVVAQHWPEDDHLTVAESLARGDVEAAASAVKDEWQRLGEAVAEGLSAGASTPAPG